MNNTKRLSDTVGLVFCTALLGALTGCTTYVDQPGPRGAYYQEPPRPREVYAPPPPVAYVPPPAVEVEASVGFGIRVESDFYEPLTPYGRWEVVGSYGRCWIPGRVDAAWRPYSNGYWQRTDAGWYWASDEPWGWATYHYGRWDYSAQYGWYWVPQTQWAPAWVSWHQSGGYVGWAPLQPSARIGRRGVVEVNVRTISPRAFVFVEERRFLEPVRPTTVIVNNTTIINRTVINEGPSTTVIEKVSGRKVQAVAVRDLRRKEEATVVTHQRTTASSSEKTIQTPVRAQEPRQIQKPVATTVEKTQPPATKKEIRQADEQKRAAKLDEDKRARQAAIQAQKEQKAVVNRAQESGSKPQPVSARRAKKEKEQVASDQDGTNTVHKAKSKPEGQQKPEDPAVSPQSSQ